MYMLRVTGVCSIDKMEKANEEIDSDADNDWKYELFRSNVFFFRQTIFSFLILIINIITLRKSIVKSNVKTFENRVSERNHTARFWDKHGIDLSFNGGQTKRVNPRYMAKEINTGRTYL